MVRKSKAHRANVRCLITGAAALLVSACGGPSGPTGLAESQGLIRRTIVHLRADGSRHVRTGLITVAQQDQEKADRRALLRQGQENGGVATVSQADIVYDDSVGNCSGTDLWVFAGNDESGAELCFYWDQNAGQTATLSDYRLAYDPFTGTWIYWSGAGSYYSGTDGGRFAGDENIWCDQKCPTFSSYDYVAVTGCASHSPGFELGTTACQFTVQTSTEPGVSGSVCLVSGTHFGGSSATVKYYKYDSGSGYTLVHTTHPTVDSSGDISDDSGPECGCLGPDCFDAAVKVTDSSGSTQGYYYCNECNFN